MKQFSLLYSVWTNDTIFPDLGNYYVGGNNVMTEPMAHAKKIKPKF